MRKKLFCLLLGIALLLSLTLPVLADEQEETTEQLVDPVFIEVSGKEDFLAFAENCRLDTYSKGLVVTLKKDIDLTGTDFSPIPIFSGSFLGEGHTVRGLELTADGSVQGLFRYLTDTATVSGLTVCGTVAPGGSGGSVGGIAGENNGMISGCKAFVEVTGNSYVGGIAGINGVTGLIEDCSVEGQVNGTHFVGGIAGENLGVIRDCVNKAPVNIQAKQNTVELSDVTLENITNSEASNTATDIGGIAGLSSGLIRKCENLADIGYPHMGYNVGGIVGTQSGHIADCVNRGHVRGRKEVGGIAGQMEPLTYVEFPVDTIQILKEQLGEMSALVDKASANASGSAGAMSGQIGALQGQAATAWEAVDTLLNADRTDTDTIIAAQNTLTGALGKMPGTIQRIAGAAQSMVGGLSRDMKVVSEHIAVMSETLNEASENMGGSVTDISDLDTEDILGGKVLNCTNRGDVIGDLNVGGIAGAVAMENDMDILEDWSAAGEESLNFDSKLRAVILGCDNIACVTGSKQNIGGIVGWQSLGLVKNTVNSGKVDGTGADYVGGISGFSLGYIRGCGAKCEIIGDTCVGGIAGTATLVTDSLSYVVIRDAAEKVGAVVGIPQEAADRQEDPFAGDLYVVVGDDMGAIDGISYSGQAEPLPLEEFLQLPELPYVFRRVTVRFDFGDGQVRELALSPGTALAAHRIPQVPQKDGVTGEWEGLSEADLSDVRFDITFHLRYEEHRKTVESKARDEEGRPALLAEGLFGFDAALDVAQTDDAPVLEEGEKLLTAHQILLKGDARVDRVRAAIPPEVSYEELRICVMDSAGNWSFRPHTISGSYAVFDLTEGDTAYAVIHAEPELTGWYIVAGVAVLVVTGLLVMVLVLRKKKASPEKTE